MTRSVDIVIIGATDEAIATAIHSARHGRRVLLVVRSRTAAVRRRLRESVRASGTAASQRLQVVTGAEVECVAGVRGVEAVLVRRINTGARIDVNASALLNFENDDDKQGKKDSRVPA